MVSTDNDSYNIEIRPQTSGNQCDQVAWLSRARPNSLTCCAAITSEIDAGARSTIMASRLLIGGFVAGMLLTGCANTLLLKYQDKECEAIAVPGYASGCNSFPIWQSFAMFCGEALCFVVVGVAAIVRLVKSRRAASYRPLLIDEARGSGDAVDDEGYGSDPDSSAAALLASSMHKYSPNPPLVGAKTLYLALPAIFDIIGTTIMSLGLLFVPASIFQMCRGALVLFVGLFSVVFLKRRLERYQWLSLFQVCAGVFLVGLSTVYGAKSGHGEAIDTDAVNVQKTSTFATTVAGVLMIVGAQIFSASQFVLEEHILGQYSIEPIRVAGFEGVYGVSITFIGIVLSHVTYGGSRSGRDTTWDVQAGLNAIASSSRVATAFAVFALSIAAFNFFGLSVTRSVSATSRSTIDTCRTLFIWLVSMALGWESFKWLQLLGFVLLVHATLVFNGVLQPFRFGRRRGALPQVDASAPNTLE